jgi:hypothetical protein
MMASASAWCAADEDEEAPGRTMLKTYLVEAHCPTDQSEPDALSDLGEHVGFRVAPTEDAALLKLTAKGAEVWCDTSLGRYWRLHTTAPVRDADKFRDTLVSGGTWLDNVWFSPRYLEGFPYTVGAEMLTFSLKHDRRPLNPTGQRVSESDFVSLRLWASRPGQTLLKIRNADVFPHGTSLTSVKLRSGDAEPYGQYCVAEYFHHGKITASGTSFDEHNRLVLRAIRDYGGVVEGIEARYALAATKNEHGHRVVVGSPIVIEVAWEVADLRHAVGRMFASVDPFRLWGLPEQVAADHYRVHAVDLHFGGVLVFDITRRTITVQLPRGVCGNTVVRFLSSLRFHVNSDTADPA